VPCDSIVVSPEVDCWGCSGCWKSSDQMKNCGDTIFKGVDNGVSWDLYVKDKENIFLKGLTFCTFVFDTLD
jgi:hypothetical protein